MSRFPAVEIVPVALITEIEDREVADGFTSRALREPVLSFRTRVVQLSRTRAERWAGARNLVAQTLLMAMESSLPRSVRLDGVIRFFLGCDEKETELLFPLLIQVGKFTEEEHAMTYKYLTKLPKPLFMEWLERDAKAAGMAAGIAKGLAEGIEKGLEQGIRASKLEDARKMLERGCDWEFITSITGIVPEDLAAES